MALLAESSVCSVMMASRLKSEQMPHNERSAVLGVHEMPSYLVGLVSALSSTSFYPGGPMAAYG